MSNARTNILGRLRAAQRQLPEIADTVEFRPMVPLNKNDSAELRTRFILEATKLNCIIHDVVDEDAAFAVVSQLMAAAQQYVSWDDTFVPLSDFARRMNEAGFERVSAENPHVQVGITGVDAALAATGSLILTSAPGKPRSASLLPPTHIAILDANDILPDLEAWFVQQCSDNLTTFQASSNVIVISGPSRTADIGMELILGAHGPGELHIILISPG
jgi:L-lactate dehydrogenase complex protein LldG